METVKNIINSSKDSKELSDRLVGIRNVYQKQTSVVIHETRVRAVMMYGFINILLDAFWYIELQTLEREKEWMLKKVKQYEILTSK